MTTEGRSDSPPPVNQEFTETTQGKDKISQDPETQKLYGSSPPIGTIYRFQEKILNQNLNLATKHFEKYSRKIGIIEQKGDLSQRFSLHFQESIINVAQALKDDPESPPTDRTTFFANVLKDILINMPIDLFEPLCQNMIRAWFTYENESMMEKKTAYSPPAEKQKRSVSRKAHRQTRNAKIDDLKYLGSIKKHSSPKVPSMSQVKPMESPKQKDVLKHSFKNSEKESVKSKRVSVDSP